MPQLGKMKCNRCRMHDFQKEADAKGMTVTIRKSYYGILPGKPGVDIYIHPKTMEIPSHYKFLHKGNVGTQEMMSRILPDDDPEKWWNGWLAEIPQECKCREASEMIGSGKNHPDWIKFKRSLEQ